MRARVLGIVVIIGIASMNGEAGLERPAVPRDPIGAIVEALKTHDIVALGEGAHGNQQAHEFRLSLIRDPRFAGVANDVMIECGNARFQDVIDKFVRGDEVVSAELRSVWQETTQPTVVCDSTIYEDFIRAARAVNSGRPPQRQLRILLGDPPIDWSAVRTSTDHQAWIEKRDTYPAEVIRREVVAKKRRALIVYGDMHLQRKNLNSNYDMTSSIADVIVSLLEKSHVRVFSIWTNTGLDLTALQADVRSWPIPSLAIVRGTTLGAADFARYYGDGLPRVRIKDGKPDFAAPIPRSEWRVLRMEDQFDAVLYLGDPSTITFSQPSRALCADPDYVETRLARIALVGLPQSEADGLKESCAEHAQAVALQFESAAITSNTSADAGGGCCRIQPDGQVIAKNVTLRQLIQSAYQRHGFDERVISGAASWVDAARFDIAAKAPAVPPFDENGMSPRLQSMLRDLLAERFKLTLRTETSERPAYALVLAKSGVDLGPRLRKTDVDCGAVMAKMIQGERPAKPTCATASYPGRLIVVALPMPAIASLISKSVDRAVVDRTGLAGRFDVELEAVEIRPPGPFGPSYRPSDTKQSIFSSLPEQLGLELKPVTAPLETLVIEHAEKPREH
jgi:uncharacterized protein (TIGR03435 family)